jgi:hypothetical protein
MGYSSDKQVVIAFLNTIDFNKTWEEIEYDMGYDMGDFSFGKGDGKELRKKIKDTAKFMKLQFDGVFDEQGNTKRK